MDLKSASNFRPNLIFFIFLPEEDFSVTVPVCVGVRGGGGGGSFEPPEGGAGGRGQ